MDYLDRQKQAQKINKIKSMIDFDEDHTNNIKSLAIETKSNATLTTRFMKAKMLMFAKTSLQSFVYDMIDAFLFSVLIKLFKKSTKGTLSKNLSPPQKKT